MVPLSPDATIAIIVVVVVVVIIVVICVVSIFIGWWRWPIFFHLSLCRSVVYVENANNAPDGHDEKRMHAKKSDMKLREQLDGKSTIKLILNVKLIVTKFVPNTIYRLEKQTLLLYRDLTFFSFSPKIKQILCQYKLLKWNRTVRKRLRFDMIVYLTVTKLSTNYLSNHRSKTIIIIIHMCSLISSRKKREIDTLITWEIITINRVDILIVYSRQMRRSMDSLAVFFFHSLFIF